VRTATIGAHPRPLLHPPARGAYMWHAPVYAVRVPWQTDLPNSWSSVGTVPVSPLDARDLQVVARQEMGQHRISEKEVSAPTPSVDPPPTAARGTYICESFGGRASSVGIVPVNPLSF
jgi:hypothetical protein